MSDELSPAPARRAPEPAGASPAVRPATPKKHAGRHRKLNPGTVLVVGLGRFGSATALTLHEQGIDVVGIDRNADLVQHYASRLPNLMVMDATDADALHALGIDSIDRAVVAMGNVEASIVTVLTLAEAGVDQIWAKAKTRTHGQIVQRVGAHHVVYPERAAGERVGHAVAGHMIDYFEFEDGFAMARTAAPASVWGKQLAESAVRTRHKITVVGVKRRGADFSYAVPETVIQPGDELVVSGPKALVERFAKLV